MSFKNYKDFEKQFNDAFGCFGFNSDKITQPLFNRYMLENKDIANIVSICNKYGVYGPQVVNLANDILAETGEKGINVKKLFNILKNYGIYGNNAIDFLLAIQAK